MTASIRQVLSDAASSRPDDIWLVTPETEKSFSWKDTDQRAETIACYLQGAGLSKGASVAIAAPNGAAASFAFLGVVYGGYRATPLNLVAGIKNACFCVTPFKNRTYFVCR